MARDPHHLECADGTVFGSTVGVLGPQQRSGRVGDGPEPPRGPARPLAQQVAGGEAVALEGGLAPHAQQATGVVGGHAADVELGPAVRGEADGVAEALGQRDGFGAAPGARAPLTDVHQPQGRLGGPAGRRRRALHGGEARGEKRTGPDGLAAHDGLLTDYAGRAVGPAGSTPVCRSGGEPSGGVRHHPPPGSSPAKTAYETCGSLPHEFATGTPFTRSRRNRTTSS